MSGTRLSRTAFPWVGEPAGALVSQAALFASGERQALARLQRKWGCWLVAMTDGTLKSRVEGGL